MPKMKISELKSNLRKKMRAEIREWILENDLEKASKSACEKLVLLEEYQKSKIVLAYIPMKNEADCIPAVLDAMKSGKIVAVPKCVPETGEMDFYILKNDLPLESQLEQGSFGIFEPKENLRLIRFAFNDGGLSVCDGDGVLARNDGDEIFVIVPGLAFTKDGKRLGKGKGFYDRFFERIENAGVKNVFKCGFCLPCQIVEKIPCDEFDRKVDFVYSTRIKRIKRIF